MALIVFCSKWKTGRSKIKSLLQIFTDSSIPEEVTQIFQANFNVNDNWTEVKRKLIDLHLKLTIDHFVYES